MSLKFKIKKYSFFFYLECKASFRYYNNLLTHKKTHIHKETKIELSKHANILMNKINNINKSSSKSIVSCSSSSNENNKSSLSYINNNDIIEGFIESLNESFNCSYCSLQFDCFENLQIHQKTHFDSN